MVLPIPVGLPFTFTGSQFSMTVDSDGLLGGKVDTITINGFDYQVSTSNTSEWGDDIDGRLWSLECRNSDHVWGGHGQIQAFDPDGTSTSQPGGISETLSLIGPDSASVFQAYDTTLVHNVYRAVTLEWREVLTEDGDKLWVRVVIKQELSISDGCKWSISFGRQRGENTSVVYAVCPHFVVKGPVATRGGISHYESQGRTRTLVPQFISTHSPHRAFHNAPMPAWHGYRVLGVDFEWDQVVSDHPAPSQLLQFYGIAPHDSADAASYKKCFYVQSEDVNGYQKSFRYQGLATGTGLLLENHFKADLMQIPSFERALGWKADPNDTIYDWGGQTPPGPLKIQDEFANSYSSPYETFVGGFTMSGEDFAFECAQRYRDWSSTAFNLTARAEANNRSYMLNGPFVQLVTNTFYPEKYNGESGNLYPVIGAELGRISSLLANPYVPVRGVVHLQAWIPGGYGIRSPSNPVTADEGIVELSDTASGLGFRTSVYTHYLSLNVDPAGGWGDTPTQDGGRKLNIRRRNYGGVTGGQDELGDDRTKDWWVKNVFRHTVARAKLGALYMDVTVGNGNIVSYPSGTSRAHNGHGGNSGIQSKKILVTEILSQLQSIGTNPDGEGGEEAMQMTEAWEEGVSHLIDWMQSGYDNMPGSTRFGEDYTLLDQYGGGSWPLVSDAGSSWQARDPNPALATLVYSKYYGLGRLAFPIERAALATETKVHSSLNPAYEAARPGVTAQQFIDAQCYWRSLSLISGHNPFSFDFHIDDYTCLMSDPNATDDPSNAGLTVWAFIKELYQSMKPDYLGDFVFGGEMEYPLQGLATYSTNSSVQTNPITALDQGCSVRKNLAQRTSMSQIPSVATNSYRCLPTFVGSSEVEIGLTEVYVTDVQNKVVQGYDVREIQDGVFRTNDGHLGIVLVNWSNNASASLSFEFVRANYGISTSYEVHKLVLGGSPILVATGTTDTVSMHSQGVGTVNLGSVGVRSLEVFTITPI